MRANRKDETTELVARLRDPSTGSPRWANTMAEAATIIERLRSRLKRDMLMEGYDEDEAAEMLRQVEAGEDEW